MSTSKCVYLFFPFSNYQKLHCLLGNLYNFAVVYILFLFAILPVPRDIMIPSSFIFAITLSILPIDIQHEIQHTQKNPFITRLFGVITKGSIPVRSAKIKKAHFPAFGQVLGSRSDPAELRRKMGLFSFREKWPDKGLFHSFWNSGGKWAFILCGNYGEKLGFPNKFNTNNPLLCVVDPQKHFATSESNCGSRQTGASEMCPYTPGIQKYVALLHQHAKSLYSQRRPWYAHCMSFF